MRVRILERNEEEARRLRSRHTGRLLLAAFRFIARLGR